MGRWCHLDPFVGAQLAVAEAARNVACSGAKPLAATNCLNFGNPEKPEVMWQFSRAVDGIAAACTALEIPITGGNVSFYNETLGPLDPSNAGAWRARHGDRRCFARTWGWAFRAEGDVILLLGCGQRGRSAVLGGQDGTQRQALLADKGNDLMQKAREFSSSEYAHTIRGIVSWRAACCVNLAAEKRLIALLVALAGEGALQSAHDVSDGGLAVTIAESALLRATGFLRSSLHSPSKEPDEAALFGERGARAVVSVTLENLARSCARLRHNMKCRGNVGHWLSHLQANSASN